MTTTSAQYQPRSTFTRTTTPRRRGRSVAAVAIGFVAVAALSLGTDEVLHLDVYPPWGKPMREPSQNLLGTARRSSRRVHRCVTR